MKFEPPPRNDFEEFFTVYFSRCQSQCPKIEVVAAKWSFEDLIPGLSDFDTRFIVNNSTSIDDWHQMSVQVGRIHTQLAREVPHWARNLEHLPGLNFSVREMTEPLLYYPEFKQWTFYQGDEAVIERMNSYLDGLAWSARDEIYHLKKIATYYGRYQRGIDPPINMGKWESKYPLHSRFMHYFAPPVQSAVSLALKRTIRGKLEAMRLARDVFPNADLIETITECLDFHYEKPDYYAEPKLTEIEGRLEGYLRQMWAALESHVTLLKIDSKDTTESIRMKVRKIPIDPIESFCEGAKFGRLMKGRLLFYAEDIPWFESEFLIRNELGRIVTNFHDKPLVAYGLLRFNASLSPPEVLDRLRGEVLTDADCDGMTQFAKLGGGPVKPGLEKTRARQIAEVYDLVLSAIDKIGNALMIELEHRTA